MSSPLTPTVDPLSSSASPPLQPVNILEPDNSKQSPTLDKGGQYIFKFYLPCWVGNERTDFNKTVILFETEYLYYIVYQINEQRPHKDPAVVEALKQKWIAKEYVGEFLVQEWESAKKTFIPLRKEWKRPWGEPGDRQPEEDAELVRRWPVNKIFQGLRERAQAAASDPTLYLFAENLDPPRKLRRLELIGLQLEKLVNEHFSLMEMRRVAEEVENDWLMEKWTHFK
ncbi:hypothetical protein CC80DRAFT_593354 [Byssothecium circinans]|uniref:Uncharacterized protein n=1 Tax=Byssothecium circinans TaxID=147558 RepID=A0A6A5TY42_9PLEO|nr:hypothetical protein CC80DRAFT_593354 [Byssothecium circinans]